MTPARYDAEVRAWRRKERRKSERFAMLASLIANVNRDAKRHPDAFTMEDFIGEDGDE
jgi:hypothetical protein